MPCDKKPLLIDLMRRSEGVTVEESLLLVPMLLSPEEAMEYAAKALRRNELHQLGGWSVKPDVRDERAYRYEPSMTTAELAQVQELESDRELRAARERKRIHVMRLRLLLETMRNDPQVLLFGEFLSELEAEIRKVSGE